LAAIAESLQTEEVLRALPDRSVIEVGPSNWGCLEILTKGTADFLAEVGEIVAWLAAALRSSPDGRALACCTPHRVRFETLPQSRFCYCIIHLETRKETETEIDNVAGRCWHGIFRNPVVVKGFPILRRPRPHTGLEIPLHMAAQLTDARRLHDFMGRFCLKGFSAMLAAVEVIGGIVLWHLYYNATGTRVSYLDAKKSSCLEGLDVNVLRSSRHVIGWCSEAEYLAGDASANYDIRSSGLRTPGRDVSLEKVTFAVGQIFTGGCQFAIGKKDTPVNISKQDHSYLAKLQWIEQRYVVLWDEGDKCGWLVKGTSALLHLLRASLEHCRNDKFSSEFLFDAKAFQEPNARFRNDSAIEALINAKNRELRLSKRSQRSFDETVTWPDGRQETVTKTHSSYTTVEDRVVELFETLEKLIDHKAHSAASAEGVNMKPRIRSHLQGWDFRDVATNRDPLHLKITTLPSFGRTWVDFSTSIRAVTLFGRGFGQLLKPVSQPSLGARPVLWQAMPTGKGFLGACTADLRDVVDNNEGDRTTKPLTLSAGIIWHNPSQHSPFALDSSVDPERWNPVQELLPASSMFRGLRSQIEKSETVDIDSCQHGAVIFGHPKSSRFSWPNTRELTAIDSPEVALSGSAEDLQMRSAEASSGSLDDSIRPGTEGMVSDGQDTQMTSPTGSLPRSQSGQSSSCLGLGMEPEPRPGFQSSAEGSPTTATEAAASASGVGLRLGIGMTAKKRAASELEGGGTSQVGSLSKRFKAATLTAGFRRGLRRAADRTERRE